MSNVDLDLKNVWPHNFSLSEAQATLGSVLLKRVHHLTEARRRRADIFRQRLSRFEELRFQRIDHPSAHSHHLLVARYDGSKTGKTNHDLIKLMSEEYGIKTIVQYYPLYRYDLFKKMKLDEADCPNTDQFFDNMISFPFHLWMIDRDFEYLIESTASALTRLRG